MKNVNFDNTRTVYTPENKTMRLDVDQFSPKYTVALALTSYDDMFVSVITGHTVSLPSTTIRADENPREALIRLLKRVFKLDIDELPTMEQLCVHVNRVANKTIFLFTNKKPLPKKMLHDFELISPDITGLYKGEHVLLSLTPLPIPFVSSTSLNVYLTAVRQPDFLIEEVSQAERLGVVRLSSPFCQAHSTLNRLGFNLDWYYHNLLTEQMYTSYLLRLSTLKGLLDITFSDMTKVVNSTNYFKRIALANLGVVVVVPSFVESLNGDIKSHTATSVTFDDDSVYPIIGRLVK